MNETLLVVTPAKNEEAYIGKTIDSMVAQTRKPTEWIIVDDGSTDDTAQIAEEAAAMHKWITVVRANSTNERRVGLATVRAIELAAAKTRIPQSEFLSVVDADVVLGRRYFETILGKFACNEDLGIAAGQIYDVLPDGRRAPLRSAPEMTAGAIKCWRRACFDSINGLVNAPGWDGIDCYMAMMNGWQTRTFPDGDTAVLHLRWTGSSHKSLYHGQIRRGQSVYYMGSHPLWALASTAFHLLDRPFVLASLCTLYGYLSACLRGGPRIADERLRRFVRARQLSKLAQFCGVRLTGPALGAD